MKKPRSTAPVSSFGPEIMAVLKAGVNSRQEFDLSSKQSAFHFMSRINALRAAMRRENHPDAERVYRAGVRIDKENHCRVIVEPKDSEFADVLKRANVSTTPTEPQPASALTPHPGVSSDSADSFLAPLAESPSQKVDETSKNHVDKPD